MESKSPHQTVLRCGCSPRLSLNRTARFPRRKRLSLLCSICKGSSNVALRKCTGNFWRYYLNIIRSRIPWTRYSYLRASPRDVYLTLPSVLQEEASRQIATVSRKVAILFKDDLELYFGFQTFMPEFGQQNLDESAFLATEGERTRGDTPYEPSRDMKGKQKLESAIT